MCRRSNILNNQNIISKKQPAIYFAKIAKNTKDYLLYILIFPYFFLSLNLKSFYITDIQNINTKIDYTYIIYIK